MWITPKKNTRKERSQRSWIFSRCNPSGHGAHLRTQECILVQIQVIEYSNNFTLETYEGRTRSPCRFRSNLQFYPLTLAEQGRLEDYIRENLEKGDIRPAHSQYSSPFFIVGKKDGKFRPVVDYRKLNSFTVPDRYPLPLIQELVDKVRDARLFTKMD